MKRVSGYYEVALIECINTKKQRYAVRWDVQVDGMATYMEHVFEHRPMFQEIESLIVSWHNEQIDHRIISGFSWRGVPVWLSSENQFNYKAAHDIAMQTDGKSLPVTFKFGTDENPVYHRFESIAEISEFYMLALAHVNSALEEGWRQKDAIDWEGYL